MNECPACGTSVKEHYSFCRSCGGPLKLPEIDLVFCTDCGTRVKASQEVCHSCQRPLAMEGPEGPEDSPPAAPGYQFAVSAWRRQSRVIALLGGSALAIFLVAWWLLMPKPQPHLPGVPPVAAESEIKGSPSASEPKPAAASPVLATATQVSPAPESLPTMEVLRKQLEELLQNMRDAQLNKDLEKYFTYYSPNFPDLDKKRQATTKNWELYNYLDLEFTLEEVKLLITGNASALVTWKITYQTPESEEIKNITQVFKILVSNESDKWRINKLELITKR